MLLSPVLVAITALSACPQLAGTYDVPSEDGAVTVTISQRGCRRIAIQWRIRSYDDSSFNTHVLVPDGAFREDPAWFTGQPAHVASARFVNERLEVVAKSTPSDSVALWRWAFALLPTRDLCTSLETSSKRPWPPVVATLAIRIDSTADAAAATRRRHAGSGAECNWPRPNEEL